MVMFHQILVIYQQTLLPAWGLDKYREMFLQYREMCLASSSKFWRLTNSPCFQLGVGTYLKVRRKSLGL